MNAQVPAIALALALASVTQVANSQTASDPSSIPKAPSSTTTPAKPAKAATQDPKRSDGLGTKAINARTGPKQDAPAGRSEPAGSVSDSPCHHAKESDA